MSQANVVPVAIISAAAAFVPTLIKSSVNFFSTGKIALSNHSIRGNPSPIPLLRIIGRCVCQFWKERVMIRPDPSIVSRTSSSPLLIDHEPSS